MFRLLPIVLLLLLVFGCRKEDHVFFLSTTDNNSSYFIHIKSMTDKDSAVYFAQQMYEKYKQNIFIDIDSSALIVTYNIKAGKFSSSYEAGENAYKLFGQSHTYPIMQGRNVIPDRYKSIIYIGNHSGFTSVYSYNMNDKKTKLVWNHKNEKVIKLDNLAEKGTTFFLTAKEIGRKGIFPFINGLKLYHYDEINNSVSLLNQIGTCIQVYTFRDSPGIFKIVYYIFDKEISTYVLEKSITYFHNGAVISEQSKTYDLVKENYPVPLGKPLFFNSPDNKYFLSDTLANNKNEIYVNESNQKFLIASLPHSLAQIGWTDNRKFLVFTTSGIKNFLNGRKNNESPSSLFIYDLERKKIVEKWLGAGYKNFYLRGDFLFFNSGFSKNAGIKIYNIKMKRLIDSIAHKGGCSLFYLP